MRRSSKMAFDGERFVAGVDLAMDKVSFIGKLALLASATSDDAKPTPGYMLPDINQITFLSGSQNQDLIDFLDDRLGKKSCYTKSKVLRIMKYLVNNGHPDFRQGLRKRSQRISEAIKFSGPPDPLHGNALYLQVRQEAKELSELLFMTSESDLSQQMVMPPSAKSQGFGMGSSGGGKLEGFGSSPVAPEKSLGDSIIDGLRDLTQRVVELSSDPKKDMTFSTNSSILIPGYRPAVVSTTETTNSSIVQNLPVRPNRTQVKRHVKGVAGGGWNDDDDDDENCLLSHSSPRFLETSVERSGGSGSDGGGCSGSSVNSDKIDNHSEISKPDDCSAERSLVNELIFVADKNGPIPEREDIKNFVSNCSNVNCEKIIELIGNGLEPTKFTYSMRSLLLLEALLRSDLVSPDFIAATCGRYLATLFLNASVDDRVRQKARKVIRILEKLAPNHPVLSSSNTVENTISNTNDRSEHFNEPVNSILANAEPLTNVIQMAEDNSKSSAFPFLSWSSSVLSQNSAR